jgi:hypothetical protein
MQFVVSVRTRAISGQHQDSAREIESMTIGDHNYVGDLVSLAAKKASQHLRNHSSVSEDYELVIILPPPDAPSGSSV